MIFYGSAFQQAHRGDLGGGDLLDIIHGVRLLIDSGYVDSQRIGIAGDSYCGFLTMIAIGKYPARLPLRSKRSESATGVASSRAPHLVLQGENDVIAGSNRPFDCAFGRRLCSPALGRRHVTSGPAIPSTSMYATSLPP